MVKGIETEEDFKKHKQGIVSALKRPLVAHRNNDMRSMSRQFVNYLDWNGKWFIDCCAALSLIQMF